VGGAARGGAFGAGPTHDSAATGAGAGAGAGQGPCPAFRAGGPPDPDPSAGGVPGGGRRVTARPLAAGAGAAPAVHGVPDQRGLAAGPGLLAAVAGGGSTDRGPHPHPRARLLRGADLQQRPLPPAADALPWARSSALVAALHAVSPRSEITRFRVLSARPGTAIVHAPRLPRRRHRAATRRATSYGGRPPRTAPNRTPTRKGPR